MSQKFYKGRTNNHLTWVMVDSTDFATPESALSAATKIKIYGKLRSAAGVNFVSSGTGSLTNDITHVGASATGVYTIALAKADLSDASAAWYDQYIITLSATGAAYQTLIVDGGIDDSYISNALSYLSNAVSYLSATLSDFQSDFGSRVPKEVAARSQLSDLASDLRSVLVGLSATLSDVDSALTSQFAVESNYLSYLSATVSSLGAGQSASAIADKVWSDFGSKAGATPSQLYSVVLRGASEASNAASGVTVLLSRVPKAVATNSQVSDLASDLKSYLAGLSATLSDTYSALSDFHSDFGSRVPKEPAARSQVSDLASDLRSYMAGLSATLSDVDSAVSSQFAALSGMVSDLQSAVSDFQADFGSRVPKEVAARSQLSDLASDLRSVIVGVSGAVSDVYSQLSDFRSNLGGVEAAAETVVTLTVVSDVNNTTASFVTNLTEASNDHYNGRVVIFRTGALAGQAAAISDYVGATKVIKVPALTDTPAPDDTAVIV